ncbi:MAG: hypothetical protein C0184_00290 [Chloroflexus aggregans]|uniref:CAAX prenyl protease 2/Lysostaphin resistance protein A-like domain-containing protein n=1 Tax=Chloroflexus aggregans TaxID=152260 RepID=A0A2J6XFY8_9CHLR|nr:MAG: hypothetical protein C0184_00290 [Chloroflexus aggregans]
MIIILIGPMMIFGGSIIVATIMSRGAIGLSVISDPPFALIAFFVILFTGGPLQEEFGWRGYALPRLQAHYGSAIASLIVGVAWWLWHAPAVFIPGRFMTNDLLFWRTNHCYHPYVLHLHIGSTNTPTAASRLACCCTPR